VIHISDIMNMGELMNMMNQGYVRTQKHPQLPYVIHNYTAAVQYKNMWNDVTEQCRGLIVDSTTGQIIARPFRKFFNWGQPGADIALDAAVHVTDKADGSLGILYPTPGLTRSGYSIATRGSFTSEQAIHATKMFNERYANRWLPHPDYTFLFEIVYPGNRIVLDYGDRDDLFMLTAVNNISGWSIPRASFWSKWPGISVTEFEYRTLQEALEAPPRTNAEGLVIHDLKTDARIKIKQDDYVALHKILTGVSARNIWEYLAVNACKHLQGSLIKRDLHWGTYLGIDPKDAKRILAVGDDWFDQFIEGVPDEFYAWLETTTHRIQNEVVDLRRNLEIKMHTYAAQARQNGSFDRATFFKMTNDAGKHSRAIVLMYDNDKRLLPWLWKSVFPGVDMPFKSISEDVA
jgi:RNA ligase